MKSHVLLSVFATYVIWRHTSGGDRMEFFYLLLSIGIFAGGLVLQLLLFLYRNTGWSGRRATGEIRHHAGAISARITPKRPWKVKAGQYVQLCLPRLGWFSAIQTHPFMIVWWDGDSDEKATSIEILFKVRRGFTGMVSRRCPDSVRVPILLGGPYGRSLNMSGYDAVLLIASDIGIAAQIPYAKQALSRSRGISSRPRVIFLAWELRRNGKLIQTLLNPVLTYLRRIRLGWAMDEQTTRPRL